MERSILDTDLYKFTTSYAYMKMFPDAECTFSFVDRNRVPRTDEFLQEFKEELAELENLEMTDAEFKWCVKNIPFIPQWYWEWLRTFSYDYDRMKPWLDDDRVLHIDVTDKNYKASLYEIPDMYSVPEVNNRDKDIDWDITMMTLDEKVQMANKEGFLFSEFGTRRRFSYEVQDRVCGWLKKHSKTCVGTSNVHFAMKYGMKPIGTHPHEWFMFHGAQYGYKNANYLALENWTTCYDGSLGIALSDTYTSDAFFRNFSLKQAKLFDGVRQDSGDEFEFIEKTIAFYKSKGIDPTTKTIVFSNALDFEKAAKIARVCSGRIKCVIRVNPADNKKLYEFLEGEGKKLIGCSFGIGTNLTCDVYDNYSKERYPSENIVMKMSRCRMNANQPWYATIKLSDDEGKHMGPEPEIESAKYQLGIK